MSHLFIVPCSATKARTLEAGPMPAKDAYTGQGFRGIRRQLEMDRSKWCILSAWYGFLWPDTWIEHYDVKMKPLKPGEPWDECFGMLTERQYGKLCSAEAVTVLGGKLYADAAEELLSRTRFKGPVHRPFAGLQIGHLLSAVKRGEWRQPQPIPT
jgi:hypothetical protein